MNGTFTRASSVAGLAVDAPEAVVEITRRDLGEVFAGEEVEYAFIVRNAGTKPLELAERTTASSTLAPPGHIQAVAMWRATDRHFARPVAAFRAAPS